MSLPFNADHGEPLEVVAVTYGSTTSILLHGEADLACLEVLTDSLAGLDLANTSTVHLDARGLAFCDVATLRALAEFARRARKQNRTVVTFGPSPMLRKMAQMMGVDADLGISDSTSIC